MDFTRLGYQALERGDHQEAINIFRRALENDVGHQAYVGLGIALYNLGEPGEAAWAFKKGLTIKPGDKSSIEHMKKIEKKVERKKMPGAGPTFRVRGSHLETYSWEWRKFFVKGINMGLGLPGYFPGEFPVKKGTYLKWFKMIHDLGANAVRTYTIHPPSFYEALEEINGTGEGINLFQGIWAGIPRDYDFREKNYSDDLGVEIEDAVDVVHGNANIVRRPGHASGRYEYDVSPYTIGFIFGREWESCAVKGFNDKEGRAEGGFNGRFLAIEGATPFEAWVVSMCDRVQGYGEKRYGSSHPVSAVNWPTLDPLAHPAESSYEEEFKIQGLSLKGNVCNENEDMESLDLSGVEAGGGAGFFSTYHAYPYYPDFMNNEFMDAENPYLSYLKKLRGHHRGQPVLIGEFGVPGSRDLSHWQRNGWSHGGHNDREQGRINGVLMKSIMEASLSGGILFSWFDEWYKRNWLFHPKDFPSGRNNLWFNKQDPEQNYGLLATYPGYPGKAVTLSGNEGEWAGSTKLYAKDGVPGAHSFNDGGDRARGLVSLSARHDEGFLYLLLETEGDVDFSMAHYLIGLDTGDPGTGEFLLPFGTRVKSPVGLKFLLHLSGEHVSRILVCHSYDRYTNGESGVIRPRFSDQGAWVPMRNRTNARRIGKGGKTFYPSRTAPVSHLRFGSLDRDNPHRDTLADFHAMGGMIEVRIPWGLINFIDPSRRSTIWKDGGLSVKETSGIRMIALSYKPAKVGMMAMSTGKKTNVADSLPVTMDGKSVREFRWDPWEIPLYHTYLKESYFVYREALSEIPGEM